MKRIKNEGKYTYFVFLFSIGPKKVGKKQGRVSNNFRGGGEDFPGGLIIYPSGEAV